ncbi:hypothetical protein Mapa_002097 [Marchantia paleacea]|nr:hypothetical protein Mapa_002097 [Marchantia paleacea]
MGNAAMKCVLHGAPTVRIMRTDGKIVEYDQPILASKVMKQHADHLVVHCTPGEKKPSGSGQRRSKLTIMRSDQMLVLGQAYLLYPIPPQYRSSLVKSQCCTLSADVKEDASEQEGRLVKGSFRSLAMRLRNQKKHLNMLTKGAKKVGDANEGAAPLLKISPPTPSFQMFNYSSRDTWESSLHGFWFARGIRWSFPGMNRTKRPVELVSPQGKDRIWDSRAVSVPAIIAPEQTSCANVECDSIFRLSPVRAMVLNWTPGDTAFRRQHEFPFRVAYI